MITPITILIVRRCSLTSSPAIFVLVLAADGGGQTENGIGEFRVAALYRAADTTKVGKLRFFLIPSVKRRRERVGLLPVEIASAFIPDNSAVRQHNNQIAQPTVIAEPVVHLAINPRPGSRRGARDQHEKLRGVERFPQAPPQRATGRHRCFVEEDPHSAQAVPFPSDMMQAVPQLRR